MIILGIDPGLAETGVGIVKSSKLTKAKNGIKFIHLNCIKTKTDISKPSRLLAIHDEIIYFIEKYKVSDLAIEGLFFFKNAKSISSVGQSMGVIMLAASRKNIRVFEYSPLKIKKDLTGYGRAKKRELQSAVRKHLGIRKLPRPTHASDALAVAICHSLNKKINKKNC